MVQRLKDVHLGQPTLVQGILVLAGLGEQHLKRLLCQGPQRHLIRSSPHRCGPGRRVHQRQLAEEGSGAQTRHLGSLIALLDGTGDGLLRPRHEDVDRASLYDVEAVALCPLPDNLLPCRHNLAEEGVDYIREGGILDVAKQNLHLLVLSEHVLYQLPGVLIFRIHRLLVVQDGARVHAGSSHARPSIPPGHRRLLKQPL
mmetsp:Transcript_1776/g.4518  ORF Transcript_1776/g.4518 Transcript_1776/m.4518 type:complete len:200 (+) Transcript_1776:424-1023(+)